MDIFIVIFESVSKEFDCDVSVFLGGIFHPVTTILRGCFDKVCSPCYVGEKVWFLSVVYDAVKGNVVAEVYLDCCQGFGLSLTYVMLLRALRPDVGE